MFFLFMCGFCLVDRYYGIRLFIVIILFFMIILYFRVGVFWLVVLEYEV